MIKEKASKILQEGIAIFLSAKYWTYTLWFRFILIISKHKEYAITLCYPIVHIDKNRGFQNVQFYSHYCNLRRLDKIQPQLHSTTATFNWSRLEISRHPCSQGTLQTTVTKYKKQNKALPENYFDRENTSAVKISKNPHFKTRSYYAVRRPHYSFSSLIISLKRYFDDHI
jgi:hypothetical protein